MAIVIVALLFNFVWVKIFGTSLLYCPNDETTSDVLSFAQQIVVTLGVIIFIAGFVTRGPKLWIIGVLVVICAFVLPEFIGNLFSAGSTC